MKFMPLFFLFSLLLLGACQESSKKKSSSSSSQQNAFCTTNYYAPGCPGYNGGTTSGVTSGSTTGDQNLCFQNPQYYWQTPGCPGYCQQYPAHQSCAGGTTSGTTSGSTTGTTTNPFPQYPSSAIYANWGVQYPGGIPPENCQAANAPSGINFTPYETRKATMSIQGGTFYDPASSIASQYTNTSAILKSVTNARTLLETDSVLKVRFKPRAQPENNATSPYCYIPSYTKMSSVAGYYRLMYSVSIVGTRANGVTEEDFIGTFTTQVNTCTQAIDLSSYAAIYPGGMYLKVYSVQSNQNVYPNNYAQFGFRDSNAFRTVRSMDCWVLDVEVAADGTKTF